MPGERLVVQHCLASKLEPLHYPFVGIEACCCVPYLRGWRQEASEGRKNHRTNCVSATQVALVLSGHWLDPRHQSAAKPVHTRMPSRVLATTLELEGAHKPSQHGVVLCVGDRVAGHKRFSHVLELARWLQLLHPVNIVSASRSEGQLVQAAESKVELSTFW